MILSVKGVSKQFGGLKAVDNVDLEIPGSVILGLIGPNGAGKSTLFELISGSLRPDSGSIRFKGTETVGMPVYGVSRMGIARTFQKLRPFLEMTVLENVMVGALVHETDIAKAREIALECIDFVGIDHKRDALANTLSTGQRKRLELARVMAKRPEVYLLDEVMAGIDQKSIGGLIELVARLRDRGGTVLLVEHNLTVVRALCDTLVAMNLGRKIAEGDPAHVLAHETVVRAYLGE